MNQQAHQAWLEAQQNQHRARVERRKAKDTFTLGLDEARAVLEQHGVSASMDDLINIIDDGIPLLKTLDGLRLNVPAFVEQARRYLALEAQAWADIEAQERQEADEDRAFTLLETVGTLDELIARELINEDARSGITITPAGWALVKALGWEGLNMKQLTAQRLMRTCEKQAVRADRARANEFATATATPPLTTWTGRLTPSGEALAAYMRAHAMPLPAPRKPTLLDPAAVYFREQPDEAAALWQQYEASRELERL